MSSETLANIVFAIISFSWVVYLMQEMFIAGASALNMSISKNEEERKQIQVISGIHFDGIEVWLIAALTITLGAFPLVFGTIFTYLYVVLFLLLYTLIIRGVSIEVIYKLESKKWVKSMVIAWTFSSILIMFVLGIFISNLFYGFPLDADGMTSSFLSAFNVTSISGGLLFVSLSLISGAAWIKLNTEGEIGDKALRYVKRMGVIYTTPILLLIVFMGFNNTDASIFIGELFTKSFIFFIFPLLSVVFAILTTYMGYNENGKKMFMFSIHTMVFFLLTGFIGTYPYMVPSRLLIENGITIFDAMVSAKTLQLIFIVVLIFYPIIIGYQTWKYIKFTDKVKLDDK